MVEVNLFKRTVEANMSERKLARADARIMSAGPLLERDVKVLEQQHPEGLPAKKVVEIFSARGMRFSEATFRKYVQLGLLPRSRRVRRRGRRGGSQGLYPTSVVRRISEIKRLLGEDYTMDEIRQKFLCATSEIDELEESLTRVFDRLETTLGELERAGEKVGRIRREISSARSVATNLTTDLRQIEGRLESRARRKTGRFEVV